MPESPIARTARVATPDVSLTFAPSSQIGSTVDGIDLIQAASTQVPVIG